MYNELKTNIVQIEIDNGSGFCFGVTTAIKKAEEELAKGGKLYCLGDIVHNGMEVERLHEAGLITIDHEQMEELQGVKVLLRAHGEPPETYALAERNNIEIIDATCPVVLQLQRRIKKQYVNNPEAQIVIFGKNGHAEVLGLVGQTESHAIVVEKFEDVKQLKESGQLDFSKDIYLYSQTTKSLDEFHRIIEYCQEHIVEGAVFKSFDTICRQVNALKVYQFGEFILYRLEGQYGVFAPLRDYTESATSRKNDLYVVRQLLKNDAWKGFVMPYETVDNFQTILERLEWHLDTEYVEDQ